MTDEAAMQIDWNRIIEKARAGSAGELAHVVRQFAVQFFVAHGRKPVAQDFPAVVIDYWREQIAPTGKRGRPPTSDWAKAVYRHMFEAKRLDVEIAKATEASITVEGGSEYPAGAFYGGDKPSDIALEAVADVMSKQRGKEMSTEAARDVVYPNRKERRRIKHNR